MSVPFSDEAVAGVAGDYGVPERDLRRAAAKVQSTVADQPGRTVDGLIYEWRQAFADDPLVERRPTEWVLCVPERVWTDVRSRANVRDVLEAALLELHRRGAGGGVDCEDGVVLVVGRV
ncbi:hypothetical protein [Halobacterium yunchengense]|uniref:hypothetical protein n=1 Tax=Halobacterium yunchengense TaxID=3108497 RepID=UPI003008EA84